MTHKEKLMSLEEKIQNHMYPSKEEFLNIHNNENFSRKDICEYFNFSKTTYLKLRKYYNIPEKKRKINYSKEDYQKRVKKTQQTLNKKYGEKGSVSREDFNKRVKEKMQKTSMEKYGVPDYSISKESIEKRKQTFIERYGVDNPMKDPNIFNKTLETNFKKYGYKHHIQSPEVREKAINTINEKYGSRSNMAKIVQSKREETNLEKYGYICCLNNPEMRLKGYLKMLSEGRDAVLSSGQQRFINKLLGGKLNYLIGYYHVDSYIEKDNIIVEYSGGGHDLSVRLGKESKEHFLGKEKARKSFFKNKKIPVLEFISKKDILPSGEEIIEIYNFAKNTFLTSEYLYCCVNLETKEIIYE